MNKFQKVGLAIAIASGMAFAQLWKVNSPYGQVQFPWVVECTSKPGFDETNANDPCYKREGGWWFGYLSGWEGTGEVGPKKCVGAAGMPADGGSTSGVNKVEAKIGGQWTNFAGADYPECEGPAITDKSNGQSLMGTEGLELRLTIGAGYISDPTYEPSLSGFGVNMGEYPTNAFKRNLENKNGFCLTYISNHQNTKIGLANAGSNMALVLGWDEGIKNNLVKGFDTWYAIIPESNGQKKTIDFRWTGTPVMGDDPTAQNEAGDFLQDNWTNWEANKGKPPGAPFPITSATQEMTSVKIRLSGYEAQVVEFKLIEFGFAGTCTGGGTPITAGGAHVNPLSFAMSGRMLSMNSSVGKPLAVQIINLQGSIVQAKTMSNGDKMSLQNLPTGIYMVRVPAQGYVAKYAIK